ncbi:MAG TPA: T9SS type A sorting domain-containing protein [Bacteroidales bacterium]|nr:T9SS type A sorting domain-containing protein [Bacteroidales bacterium]
MKSFKVFVLLFITLMIRNSGAFAQLSEGDTMSFWSVTYIDWPPLAGTPQHVIHATCDKVGQYCYIFRESSLPPFQQWQLDTLVHKFDYHFVPELTAVYGPLPDTLDNDPRVYILIHDEPDWCGYFDPAQQMTDGFVYSTWGRHSSEHEIIYIAASCFNSAVWITAHEFGHMLHSLQDHSPEPPSNPVMYWEEAWIDEGFSTFAAMYLTENIFEPSVTDHSAFFSHNPDIPLIYFSNYNQVKLWTLFMFEHYGGWNYISALISNQLNGIAGMDSALRQINAPATFDEAFLHWSVTNFLDDSVFEGGKYSYNHYNFDSCVVTATHNTYPTGVCTQSVKAFGTDYLCFDSPGPNPMIVSFSAATNSEFRLAAIKMIAPSGYVTNIDYIIPDGDGNAIVNADSFGVAYNKLVLVVCSTDSSIHEGNSAAYAYFTESTANIENLNPTAYAYLYPNPVKDVLNLHLPLSGKADICIYDLPGKEIYTSSAETGSISIDISKFKKGIYILKYSNTAGTIYRKFIKE